MTDWLTEAARRHTEEPELPDGLEMINGRPSFQCRVCEAWTEWPAELEDFYIDDPHNVCGRSPRCCP